MVWLNVLVVMVLCAGFVAPLCILAVRWGDPSSREATKGKPENRNEKTQRKGKR